MQIKSSEFKGAYVAWNKLPTENQPEIALVGRSNVGKSSLINKIVNRKNLAKSSSIPGKTRTINFYLINNYFNIVDLPGYGYARVAKAEQQKWGNIIENYLKNRKQLRGVIHLIDIRHEPSEKDILMKDWLNHYEIPILIVATKADKISRSSRHKQLQLISSKLNLNTQLKPIIFSATSGEGVQEICGAIAEILA
ncbi:MAG: ribosome biogenesis GTP-binding protein YihA/YsxC [Syntrophomonadaceae bacterium]|jgi:GTP-binding protein